MLGSMDENAIIEFLEIENKKKMVYYKETSNLNLEYQNYLFIVASIKTKINIAKKGTNSHELYSEVQK